MNKNISVFLAMTLVFLMSCTSLSHKNKHVLKLENVEKLKVAKTSRAEAQTLLKKPDKILLLKESSEEIWLYLEGKYNATRLSLNFDSSTGLLQTIGWFVRENDLEAELEQSKARYETASFLSKEAEWVNSHAGPDDIYFSDQNMGLEIQYGKNRQKVKSITWRSPEAMRDISEVTLKTIKYEL